MEVNDLWIISVAVYPPPALGYTCFVIFYSSSRITVNYSSYNFYWKPIEHLR